MGWEEGVGQKQRGQNPGWEHGPLGPEGGRRGGETQSGLEPRDAATWVVWDRAARGPGEMPAAQTAAGRPPVRPRWPAQCEEGGPRGGPHPAADGRAPALFVMGQCRHGEGLKDPPKDERDTCSRRKERLLKPTVGSSPCHGAHPDRGPLTLFFPLPSPLSHTQLKSTRCFASKEALDEGRPPEQHAHPGQSCGCTGGASAATAWSCQVAVL